MGFKYKFTVFTPAYNAERTLYRVFDSLKKQTFRSFEWIIVDDGSTDNTTELVESMKSDMGVDFSIRYFWQKNQHKKVAHNKATRDAQGELFLPADSDDCFPPEALQLFLEYWESIPKENQDKYAGVTGLCQYEDGTIVRDLFPTDEWIDSSPQEIRYRYRVKGEKWGFTKTELLRAYPFPEEIPGYVPEGIVWDEIGRQYLTRFVNKPLRIYFQESQASKKGKVRRAKAPGRLHQKNQVLSKDIGWFKYAPLWFLMEAARLNRFYLHCYSNQEVEYWPSSWGGRSIVILTFPLGTLWYLNDQLRFILSSKQKTYSEG